MFLPTDDLEPENGEMIQYPSMLSVSSNMNLSSSLSSLTQGSPTEKEITRDTEGGSSSSLGRSSYSKTSKKHVHSENTSIFKWSKLRTPISYVTN